MRGIFKPEPFKLKRGTTMAVLIQYATKSGTTEQCAKVLSEELPQSKICNIEIEKPSLEAFILGAGVREFSKNFK